MPAPIIKLSNITNLHDARFGAGMGTLLEMMIGFSLNPNHKNYVTEPDFVQISSWITGCKIVAELGNEISKEAQAILSNTDYTIDFVEISNISLLSQLREKNYDFPIIFSTKIENIISLEKNNDIDYLLIEAETINITENDIHTLQKLATEYSVILSFGITNKNVLDLISQTNIKGIAFKGQTETEIGMGGYTDFDEISDILEKVEELS